MAKKDKNDLDEFNLDEFNEFDDLGFGEPVPDNRKPTVKMGSGVLHGMKDELKNPSVYKTLLKSALPGTYQNIWESADDVASTGFGLYNELKEEIKPATRQLKRFMRFVKPGVDPVLPDWLAKKLDSAIAAEESSGERKLSEEEIQTAQIQSELAQVFKAQGEAATEDRAEQRMRDMVDTKRHEVNVEQQATVQKHLGDLVSYQNSITNAWQKKTLELNYRSYFSLRDMLKLQRATAEDSLSLLRAISKNTGLPDFVKLNTDEALKHNFREALFGKIREKGTNSFAPYLNKFSRNISGEIKNFSRDFAQSMDMSMQLQDAIEGIRKDSTDMGGDADVAVGELAGRMVTDGIAGWLGRKIGTQLAKNKELVGFGYKAARFKDEIPNLLMNYRNTATQATGFRGNLEEFIKRNLPGDGVDREVAQDNISNLLQPAVFTNKAHTALVDIIPGLLSRILQSSEGIRTGEKVEAQVWDWNHRTFTDHSAMRRKVAQSILSKNDMDARSNDSIAMLDIMGADGLNDSQKGMFKSFLLDEVSRRRGFNEKEFVTAANYAKYGSTEDAIALAKHAAAQMGMGDDGKTSIENVEAQKRLTDLSKLYRGMRTSEDTSVEKATLYHNLGFQDMVRSLGITDYAHGKESINETKVNAIFSDYRNKGQDYEKVIDAVLGLRGMDGSSDNGGSGGTGGVDSLGNPLPPSPSGNPLPEKKTRRTLMEILAGRRAKQDSERVTQQTTLVDTDALNESLTSHVDRVIEAIREISVKTESVHTVQTLHEILETVKQIGVTGDGGGGGTPGGKPKAGFFKRAGARGWRGLKRAGLLGWRGSRATLRGGLAAAKKIVTAPWRAAKWMGSKIFGRIQDIHVPGRNGAVITAIGLKAGEYFDALTGDPIKTIDDIKGAVVRKVGELTEQVLSKDEFDRGLYDSTWTRVKTGFGRHFDTALGLGGKVFGFALKPFKFAWNIAKDVNNWAFGAPDVFVPGESSPRMIGKLIDEGKTYFGSDAKPIRSIADIKTDVFHKDDFSKPILYYDEFSAGVVNYQGKPIKTNYRKVMDVVTLPFQLAKKAFSGVKKGASWLFGKAGGLLSGIFGGMGGAFNGMGASMSKVNANVQYQIENINVLKRIYNLLCEQFGKGEPMDPTEAPQGGPGLKGAAKGLWKRVRTGWKLGRRKWDRDASKREELKSSIVEKAKGKLAEAGITDESIKTFRTNHNITAEDIAAKRDAATRKLREGYDGAKSTKDKFGRSVARALRRAEREKGGELNPLDKLKALAGMLGQKLPKRDPSKPSVKDRVKNTLSAAGERANSWKDILAQRAAKRAAKRATGATSTSQTDKGSNGFGFAAMLATLTGMWGSIKGIGTSIAGYFAAKKAMDVAGGIADAAGGIDTDGKGKSKGKNKPAPGGNKKGLLRRGLGGLWAGTKWAVTTALPWALRGALAVGGAVAGAVTSPVVLGVAAAAAVAVGGYYAYKYFTSGSPGLLTDLRMAQYGISTDFKEGCTKIAEVERYVKSFVTWDGDKPTNIGLKSANTLKVMEILGVDPNTSDQVYEFTKWYDKRFKPVYLSNLAAFSSLGYKGELLNVDKIVPDVQKLSFAKKTMLATNYGGAYYVSTNSIPDAPVTPGTKLIERKLAEIADKYDPAKVIKAAQGTPIGNAPNKSPITGDARSRAEAEARAKSYSGSHGLGNRPVPQTQTATTPKDITTPNSPMLSAVPNRPKTLNEVISRYDGEVGTSQAGEGTYASIPKPKGNGYTGVAPTITAAAQAIGIDPQLALSIAGIESSFKTMAKSRTSSAAGLFQFINDTWREQLQKHGSKLGIPRNATQMDPVANSLLGAQYLKTNKESLESTTGKPIGDTELYLAHFLGLGGARTFLKADPNEKAAKILPNASSANVPIFFDGSRPRTVGEVHDLMRSKVARSNSNVMKRNDNIYVDEQREELPLNNSQTGNVESSLPVDAKPQLTTKDIPGYGKKPTDTTKSLLERSALSDQAMRRQATASYVEPVRSPLAEKRAMVDRVEQQHTKRVEQVAAQQQTHSKTVVELHTTTNDILSSSLDTQKRMESHLSRLVALAEGSNVPKSAPATPKPTEAPRAPIPMQRNS